MPPSPSPLLALPLLLAVGALAGADPVRERTVINRDWRFLLDDAPGAAAVDFDDRAWEEVGLPHSFSLPQFAAGNRFYVGYGWYRKRLTLAAESLVGRRVSLEFEAAFQDAEVFVNGQAMARHQGGYTGFTCDITAAVVPGPNLRAPDPPERSVIPGCT